MGKVKARAVRKGIRRTKSDLLWEDRQRRTWGLENRAQAEKNEDSDIWESGAFSLVPRTLDESDPGLSGRASDTRSVLKGEISKKEIEIGRDPEGAKMGGLGIIPD